MRTQPTLVLLNTYKSWLYKSWALDDVVQRSVMPQSSQLYNVLHYVGIILEKELKKYGITEQELVNYELGWRKEYEDARLMKANIKA